MLDVLVLLVAAQSVAPAAAPYFSPQAQGELQQRALQRCADARRVCRVKPGVGIIMEPQK